VRESDRPNSQRGARPGRWGRVPGSRGLTAIAALSGAACLFLAACSSGSPAAGAPAVKAKSTAKATPAAINAQLSITPGNGGHNVDPNAGVKVTAKSGTIKTVTVTAGNAAVSGAVNGTHTVWQSAWALAPSTSYTVHATAVNGAGQTITSTSRFHTLTPAATNTAQIFEGQQSYGVGMPIRLTFSSPVTNKAAVERALQVTSSKPVTGAWYWDGDQTLYFRPMNYWPANTTVSFDGHLNGVRASPGVYFTADLTQSFSIGRSLIVVANTKTHYLNVFLNGNLYGHWAMSSGQPGLDTTDGSYITLEKANPTRMVGNGYNELVNYAVRFTYSGDYLHSAPWSVAQQGYTNVSHGCLNLSPDHATTYYNMALEGDPVTIIGSPAAGKWGDGFTVWFLSWQQLLNGSALGQAVQAGPSGSTFVSPSAVTETPTANRLAGSQAGNALAQ
jgi:lipoprotein-anchoring transpeptidase ErfK/SrfK